MSAIREKVAIVDDDPNSANATKVSAEDAHLDPVILTGEFADLKSAVDQILGLASMAICDQRLSYKLHAPFDGARLVAELYDNQIPAILVSQYLDMDHNVPIRRWRNKIPVILSRKEATPEGLSAGLETCRRELSGDVQPDRKPSRVLLRIEFCSVEGVERAVDVIIPSWNPNEAVRFPVSLLPSEIKGLIPGEPTQNLNLRLFAEVNIGAERSADLFFQSFELAPETDDNDGLT